MKMIYRLTAAIVFATSTLAATTASADVSYNIGWASEYYYRGILQKNSSASAGVDFEDSGFYVGAWTADVGDGLEVDGYFGYGIETESGFTASVGFTGYYYTGEFDDTYEELNLNFGYSIFGLEYSTGSYDNFGGPEQDYDFLALSVSFENGFYGTYGSFSDDFDGDYIEIGYGTTIADLDIGIAAVFSDESLSDQLDSSGRADDSEALVFSISKSF